MISLLAGLLGSGWIGRVIGGIGVTWWLIVAAAGSGFVAGHRMAAHRAQIANLERDLRIANWQLEAARQLKVVEDKHTEALDKLNADLQSQVAAVEKDNDKRPEATRCPTGDDRARQLRAIRASPPRGHNPAGTSGLPEGRGRP
jgi:hypothetical protein